MPKNLALQPKNFRMGITRLNSKTAAEYLAKSKGNRPIKMPQVHRYANLLHRNKWHFGTTFIAFDKKGALLNCHHFCMSIIEAQKIADVPTWWGISEEAFKAIDCGIGRSVADNLYIVGHRKYLGKKSAALRCYDEYINSDFETTFPEYEHGRSEFDSDYAIEMMDRKEVSGKIDWAVTTLFSKQQQNLISDAVVIFLGWVFNELHGEEQTETFFHKLTTGEELAAKSPILKLRNKIIELKKSGTIRRSRLCAYIVLAWNDYVENIHNKKKLQWNEHLLGTNPDKTKPKERQPKIL